MRRLGLIFVAVLLAPATAHAATLTIAPRDFSPAAHTLSIAGSLTLPRRVGVELATRRGGHVGWIVRPARRQHVVVGGWDGRLRGRRVADGRYLVRLLYGGKSLAAQPVQIDAHAPELGRLRVSNGSTPFAGDGPLLTTVSPNGDGLRDGAVVHFRLGEPATVTLEVTRTVKRPQLPVSTATLQLPAGAHTLHWKPAPTLNPRTYMLRFRVTDAAGNVREYGAGDAFVGRAPRTPVVRLQGIDASSARQSYTAGQLAVVHVSSDAPQLTLKILQAGPEQVITYADNQLAGIEVPGTVETLDWTAWRSTEHDVVVRVPNVRSGFYFVQFGAPDGRVGYAPFVVRPTQLGVTGRVLVVLPTNTWEAYNFQDVNGDGYGDTWYAGAPNQTVDLRRPYIARGVPPRFYRYDLPFLHWLYWSGKNAEFISD
ncbi:MAG: N,N-dimethylformamidase beta subunit family domain-containing protein, partial [Actinomycetota bacterium]